MSKSQPCSRVVPVESPQCSAWFCWETGMSHHSVGVLKLGLNLEQLNGSRFDLGFYDSPVTWSSLLNLLASLLPRASKMRLSTPRSPSAVRNLTLFSTLRIAHRLGLLKLDLVLNLTHIVDRERWTNGGWMTLDTFHSFQNLSHETRGCHETVYKCAQTSRLTCTRHKRPAEKW